MTENSWFTIPENMKRQFSTSVKEFEWIMAAKGLVRFSYLHDEGYVLAYDGNHNKPFDPTAILKLNDSGKQIKSDAIGTLWW